MIISKVLHHSIIHLCEVVIQACKQAICKIEEIHWNRDGFHLKYKGMKKMKRFKLIMIRSKFKIKSMQLR